MQEDLISQFEFALAEISVMGEEIEIFQNCPSKHLAYASCKSILLKVSSDLHKLLGSKSP